MTGMGCASRIPEMEREFRRCRCVTENPFLSCAFSLYFLSPVKQPTIAKRCGRWACALAVALGWTPAFGQASSAPSALSQHAPSGQSSAPNDPCRQGLPPDNVRRIPEQNERTKFGALLASIHSPARSEEHTSELQSPCNLV